VSRKLVSNSKSHDWPVLREFVRLAPRGSERRARARAVDDVAQTFVCATRTAARQIAALRVAKTYCIGDGTCNTFVQYVNRLRQSLDQRAGCRRPGAGTPVRRLRDHLPRESIRRSMGASGAASPAGSDPQGRRRRGEAQHLARSILKRRASAPRRIGVAYRIRELIDPEGWVGWPIGPADEDY